MGCYKFLAPVGNHPIVDYWKEGQELPSRIIDAVNSLHWVAIDIVRIGESIADRPNPSIETLPVVLLISVRHDSTTWENAHLSASVCKAILNRFSIHDVEVEIKESQFGDLSSTGSDAMMDLKDKDEAPCLYSGDPGIFQVPTGARPIYEQLVAPLRHLSDCIGARLAPDAWMNYAGTKGVYLRVAPTNPEDWSFEPCTAILTCRHVVFRFGSDKGKLYRWDGQPASQHFVSQDVPRSENIQQQVKDTIQAAKFAQESLDRYLMRFPNPEEQGRRRFLEQKAEEARLDAEQAKLVDRILAQAKDLTVRVGHVLFAQELSTMPPAIASSQSAHLSFSDGPWLRDYALVQVSDSVHARKPRNRLPISWEALRSEVWKQCRKGTLSYTFKERSTNQEAILSSDIVPEQEIWDWLQDQRIVGKFGGMSDLTFGIMNGVKSVTRHLSTNIRQGVPTWEICVINPFRPKTSPQHAFSVPRDSGSAVWDLDGRILGIVSAGVGADKELLDTTYVTCMDRILRDMEDSGIQATIL